MTAPRNRTETVLLNLVENCELPNSKNSNVSGTKNTPPTSRLRSAYVAAYAAAYVGFTGNPESLFSDPF